MSSQMTSAGMWSARRWRGDVLHLRLRVIRVARLLVAQRPERRQRRGAGQPGVVLDHLLGVGAVEDVVVQGASRRGEAVAVGAFAAEVKAGPERVVEQDADGPSAVHLQKEGNRLVDGVGGFLPAEVVGVPHGESFAVAVERAGLVAKAEEVVVKGLGLLHLEAVGAVLHRDGVFLQDVPLEVHDRQPQLRRNDHAQRTGGKAQLVWLNRGAGRAAGREHGPGGVFRRLAGGPDSNPEDVRAQRVDSQRQRVPMHFDPAGCVGRRRQLTWRLRSKQRGCRKSEQRQEEAEEGLTHKRL